MKIISPLIVLTCFFALVHKIRLDNKVSDPQRIHKEKFQRILDAAGVEGAILLYDMENETYFSNDFAIAETQHCPASTFKIANSLIALELGVVDDEESVLEWDSISRSINNWNQDLSFKEAFHYSCVPSYQEIARQVGAARMDSFLNEFDYGLHDVNANNIDMFWLEGLTKISQLEQIDFLKKFYLGKLSLSERTYQIAKDMMIVEEGSDYKMIAKSGLSVNGDGWYVGYIEKADNTYFFATYLKMADNNNFSLRAKVSYQAFEEMQLIVNRP